MRKYKGNLFKENEKISKINLNILNLNLIKKKILNILQY